MRPSILETLESRSLFNGLPMMSIAGASIVEGDTGNTTVALIVSLSQTPKPNPSVTVNYATQNGTAAAGADYVAASGKLTFAMGETSKKILVAVIGDRIAEGDETFFVNLQGAKGAKIANSQGVVTIIDDEPRVSIAGGSVEEGNSGTTTLNVTATLSRASDQPVTVNYGTQDGSAIAGTDYQPTSGTVTFGAGETSKTISVQVIGDRLGETDEYFYVNLSGAFGANMGVAQAMATVFDDEPRLSVFSYGGNEGDLGTTDFYFSVYLSRAYDQAVTVNYATNDYNAIAGIDYVATSGTFTFAPGETLKTFTVQVIGNTIPEDTKYFSVSLTEASANASIDYPYADGIIYDDDGYIPPDFGDGGYLPWG